MGLDQVVESPASVRGSSAGRRVGHAQGVGQLATEAGRHHPAIGGELGRSSDRVADDVARRDPGAEDGSENREQTRHDAPDDQQGSRVTGEGVGRRTGHVVEVATEAGE